MAVSLSADYAEQLWTLSNAITAFSVIQTLAFGYQFKDDNFTEKVSEGRLIITFAIVASTIVYAVGIYLVDDLQLDLLREANATPIIISAVDNTRFWKIVLVGLCCFAAVVLVWIVHGHRKKSLRR